MNHKSIQSKSLNIKYERIPDYPPPSAASKPSAGDPSGASYSPQQLHNSNQIDEDDDDNLTHDHEKYQISRRNSVMKYGFCVFFIFLFIGILFSYIMSKYGYIIENFQRTVHIYQTSLSHGDRLTVLNKNSMKERGFCFSNLKFANKNLCLNKKWKKECAEICESNNDNVAHAHLDSSIHYQEILGFGGAFTESSAYNFFKLPVNIQEEVLELYFGNNGIGYSLGRIHINSCDFSLSSYSYDDKNNDFKLQHFDSALKRDQEFVIPFVSAALKMSKHPVKILASPWSPPAWMKVPVVQHIPTTIPTLKPTKSPMKSPPTMTPTNAEVPPTLVPSSNEPETILPTSTTSTYSNVTSRRLELVAEPRDNVGVLKANVGTMTGSSQPNGLKADARILQAWAKYISLFVSSYQDTYGITLWGVTVQNEPEFAAPWEACVYNSTYEKYFVDNYLGPTLRQDHPDLKILGFDHNKDHVYTWAEELYHPIPRNGSDPHYNLTNLADADDPQSSISYVDGIAFHWYSGGGDRNLDGTYGYNNVNATYHLNPKKILLATEGCNCPGVSNEYNSWSWAENYGHDILFDLNSFAQGWVDWNLLLDSRGGPNHLKNYCDSPILTTADFSNIIINPKYYYIGHISKFVSPGSKRISFSVAGDFQYADVDPSINSGYELGVYNCEKSSRQVWNLVPSSSNNWEFTLALNVSMNKSDAAPSYCVGRGSESRNYLKIYDCGALDNSTSLTFLMVENVTSFHLVDAESELCVTLTTLHEGGLFYLDKCDAQNVLQIFSLTESGELIFPDQSDDDVKNPKCVTAGWPFLTGAAFMTRNDKIVIVVMNEAPVSTLLTISDESRGNVWTGIPDHSIQTIFYTG